MKNGLELSLVKNEAIPRSKTAFISTTGGKPGIFFSRYLTREIGMVMSQNVAFYADQTNEDGKYIWGFYLTNNTLHTEVIRQGRPGAMFRVNAKKASTLIQKAFRIKNGVTVRLFVDIKNPIKYKAAGEDVIIYMIYDIPPMRTDLDEHEMSEYNDDYIEKMTKIKSNYGINTY